MGFKNVVRKHQAMRVQSATRIIRKAKAAKTPKPKPPEGKK